MALSSQTHTRIERPQPINKYIISFLSTVKNLLLSLLGTVLHNAANAQIDRKKNKSLSNAVMPTNAAPIHKTTCFSFLSIAAMFPTYKKDALCSFSKASANAEC
jgi:hypothetical protein